MYPEVFAEFAKFERDYGDVAVLPTRAFFYGLKPGEEISVDIEPGKTLFIKLDPPRRGGQGGPPHRHLRTERHGPRDRHS